MNHKFPRLVTLGLTVILALACVACATVDRSTVNPVQPAAKPDPVPTEDLQARAAEIVSGMTLKQKVAQLFIITPEALTEYDTVTAAGRVSKEAFTANPVGGLIYFARNLENPDQTKTMLSNMQTYSVEALGIPLFLCVDEEGGDVVRVAGNPAFGITNVGDARVLGEIGDATVAAQAAKTIAGYLTTLGFTVNFAPVADMVEDPAASSLGDRSFGGDADTVAAMVSAQVQAYLEGGILPCVKHFPGIGAAAGDSHDGAISVTSTLAQLQAKDLVPFAAAIEAGVPFVMIGHVGVPSLVGSDMPASMSSIIIEGLLRKDLGFEGLVITDALNMGAVRNLYTDRRMGVEALLAGVDVILMPADYGAAYQGILDAVKAGELTEERIDQSVTRIVMAKLQLGYNAPAK